MTKTFTTKIKGKKVLVFQYSERDKKPFYVSYNKAKLILNHYFDIIDFVRDNGGINGGSI